VPSSTPSRCVRCALRRCAQSPALTFGVLQGGGLVCLLEQCCGTNKTVQYRQIPRGTQEASDLLDDLNDDEFDDDAVEATDATVADRV